MPLGMFLFFFVFYNVTLNITRQSIAVSIIIYSLKYLEKKDYKKLIFLFILAFLFHRSATFALLMYGIYILINSKKLNYRSKIAIITVISALLVIVNLYFIPIINLAYKINLVPKKYIDYLINNNQLVKINKIGLITRLIFIIIYVFNKNKNKNSLPYFVYLIMELGILSMSTLSDNFIRIGYYLYLPALFVVIPNTYTILKNTKKNKIIFTLFIMCIFIFSWYREFIIANSSETYPYISIFNK
jgi:succinate dehydrogenase/fumarate reductase cytochrome b subunit